MDYIFFAISVFMVALVTPAIFDYSLSFLGDIANYGILFYTSFSYVAFYLPLYFFALGYMFLKKMASASRIVLLNLTILPFITLSLLVKIVLTAYSKMSYVEQQIVLILGEGAPLILFALFLVEVLVLWKLFSFFDDVDSNLGSSIDYDEEEIPHSAEERIKHPVMRTAGVYGSASDVNVNDYQLKKESHSNNSFNHVDSNFYVGNNKENSHDYDDYLSNEIDNVNDSYSAKKSDDFSFLDVNESKDHEYRSKKYEEEESYYFDAISDKNDKNIINKTESAKNKESSLEKTIQTKDISINYDDEDTYKEYDYIDYKDIEYADIFYKDEYIDDRNEVATSQDDMKSDDNLFTDDDSFSSVDASYEKNEVTITEIDIDNAEDKFNKLGKNLNSATVKEFRREYANDKYSSDLHLFDSDDLDLLAVVAKNEDSDIDYFSDENSDSDDNKTEEDLLNEESTLISSFDFIEEKESKVHHNVDDSKYKEEFPELSYRVHDFSFDKVQNNTALDPYYLDEVSDVLSKHNIDTTDYDSAKGIDNDEIDKIILETKYQNVRDELEKVKETLHSLADDSYDKEEPKTNDITEDKEYSNHDNVEISERNFAIDKYSVLSDEEEEALNHMANDIAQSNREEAHISAILSDVNRNLDNVLNDKSYDDDNDISNNINDDDDDGYRPSSKNEEINSFEETYDDYIYDKVDNYETSELLNNDVDNNEDHLDDVKKKITRTTWKHEVLETNSFLNEDTNNDFFSELANQIDEIETEKANEVVVVDDFNPLEILTNNLDNIEKKAKHSMELEETLLEIDDAEAYFSGAVINSENDNEPNHENYSFIDDDYAIPSVIKAPEVSLQHQKTVELKPIDTKVETATKETTKLEEIVPAIATNFESYETFASFDEPQGENEDMLESDYVSDYNNSSDDVDMPVFDTDNDDSLQSNIDDSLASDIDIDVPSNNLLDDNYLVPIDGILDSYENNAYWEIDEATLQDATALENALKEFNIEAKVMAIRKGPVVTMFEILPSAGVKLSKIEALSDNITFRLAANSVRIVAPIPGKQAVGIEVPNRKRSMVAFSDLINCDDIHSDEHAIPIALGKNIEGKSQVIDLARTPHLLIAGSTGSGKSVCVNSIICSILYTRKPKDVKLMLIDPKVVELKPYNDIAHLLTPVITEPKKALQAVQWTMYEMERRYSLMDNMNAKNIKSYNKKIKEQKIATEKLPYIVLIIDEFADLIASCGKELEINIARLAAKSRAAGIHLILATQRPSADVITGLIKANFPSRIAFKVASKIDSRIILDMGGADQLLGRGDMLFVSSWDPYAERMQSPFLSEDEVDRITDYVRSLGEPDYIDDEIFVDDEAEDSSDNPSLFEDEDPLFDKAIAIVVEQQKASASYLQRRLRIGYNRAARLVEIMEERHIVGPANGSKPREVLRAS